MMKLSIAMATYNGARYIKEQLDSFANQSLMPDELIVCDDLSTDNTIHIINDFAESAPFEVRVVVNNVNLGYTRNFEKALSLCTGDIIFISDQDDVWFENKISFVTRIFETNKYAYVVINDQELTDELLNPSGLTNFSNTFSTGMPESWLSAGCCTAIRSEFMQIIYPFPVDVIPYDGWIHKIAHILGVRTVTSEILQFHRRHDKNASQSIVATILNPRKMAIFMEYGLRDVSSGWIGEVELTKYLVKTIIENRIAISGLSVSSDIDQICANERTRIEAIKRRIHLVKTSWPKRMHLVLSFYISGGYNFFSGWKSAIKDLIR
jgi:glycosyltransferase involved in cell wall biosynthesis